MSARVTLKHFYVYPLNRPRLSALNLSLQPGDTLAIVGPTGCGKSVLLKALVGLAPFSGEIELCGERFIHAKPKALSFSKKQIPIGFAFEKNALFEFLTVEENLILGSAFQVKPKHNFTNESNMLLRKTGLWDHRGQLPSTLSGGMKKRLAVARALVKRPAILICDTPLAGLDPLSAHTVFTLLQSAADRDRATLIMTLQSMTLALKQFTHLLMLNAQGNSVFCGRTNEFYCPLPYSNKKTK